MQTRPPRFLVIMARLPQSLRRPSLQEWHLVCLAPSLERQRGRKASRAVEMRRLSWPQKFLRQVVTAPLQEDCATVFRLSDVELPCFSANVHSFDVCEISVQLAPAELAWLLLTYYPAMSGSSLSTSQAPLRDSESAKKQTQSPPGRQQPGWNNHGPTAQSSCSVSYLLTDFCAVSQCEIYNQEGKNYRNDVDNRNDDKHTYNCR